MTVVGSLRDLNACGRAFLLACLMHIPEDGPAISVLRSAWHSSAMHCNYLPW